MNYYGHIGNSRGDEMVIARKILAGTTELAALGVFVGMVWLWGAVLSSPGV